MYACAHTCVLSSISQVTRRNFFKRHTTLPHTGYKASNGTVLCISQCSPDKQDRIYFERDKRKKREIYHKESAHEVREAKKSPNQQLQSENQES